MKAHHRIMLVDDHEVVRLGIKRLLQRRPGFEVVAEARTVTEAANNAISHEPDVVLMDIRLSGGSGIDARQQITQQLPRTRVVMLTSYAEDEMLFAAIRAGAAGYVLKQIDGDDLVRAIEAAVRWEASLNPAHTQRAFAKVRQAVRKEEPRRSMRSRRRR